MKRNKRIVGVLLIIAAVVTLLSMQVLAAGVIDLNHKVEFTISYQEENTPITDTEFHIYLVATVDAYGELTTTEEFSRFNVNIRGKNDDAWKTLASSLEGYVLRDNLSPTDSAKTNEQGLISFPTGEKKLTPGLYLVLGSRHTQDGYIYDPQSFVVMLPSLDKEVNDWDYDVTVIPKSDKHPNNPDNGTITRKVLKVWKDTNHTKERPKEITVSLLQDGKVYDIVTLNASNNWRHTWENLDDDYRWTVVEDELNNYTVAVIREGVTFVVTNTYDIPDNPSTSKTTSTTSTVANTTSTVIKTTTSSTPTISSNAKLPQTGQLWWPVPLLIAVGLFLIIIGLFRRKGTRHEK